MTRSRSRERWDSERWVKFREWFEEGLKVNAHQEEAVSILRDAIQSAGEHPNMTPEVKGFVELFLELFLHMLNMSTLRGQQHVALS